MAGARSRGARCRASPHGCLLLLCRWGAESCLRWLPSCAQLWCAGVKVNLGSATGDPSSLKPTPSVALASWPSVSRVATWRGRGRGVGTLLEPVTPAGSPSVPTSPGPACPAPSCPRAGGRPPEVKLGGQAWPQGRRALRLASRSPGRRAWCCGL